ncbi:MAG: TIGR03618 family F420-dependent PPOX class oxidoreductase [Chloroflexales bacterium]|nr:TIGR03618 family F420-dependent PPOX class oxidoreductase [Chloroflexales bacterium]
MVLTERQRAFLDEVHYAVVGTLNQDGTIQQTVVWYMLDANDIRFNVAAHSVKVRNLSHNPLATLTVVAGTRYLSLSGSAIVEPLDADLRYRMAVRYLGSEQARIWVAKRPELERASVRLTIRQVYGQGV